MKSATERLSNNVLALAAAPRDNCTARFAWQIEVQVSIPDGRRWEHKYLEAIDTMGYKSWRRLI